MLSSHSSDSPFSRRFFLTGFPGSGKSHTGRQLADRLGLPFYDLDTEIEEAVGNSVPEIFAQHGEEYFRRLERDVLAELISRCPRAVIATGGGTPCFYDNNNLLLCSGIVVFLHVSPKLLLTRLKRETEKRPLLHGKSEQELKEYISRKTIERLPYYQKCHLAIRQSTDTQDNAAEILKQLADE